MVGGTFFWLFLSEGVFSLKYIDLFVGFLLMFLGVARYFVLSWKNFISVYFGKMSFMQ